MRLHDIEKYCQPFDTVIVDGGSDVLDTMIIHSVLDKIEYFGIWCGRTANKHKYDIFFAYYFLSIILLLLVSVMIDIISFFS